MRWKDLFIMILLCSQLVMSADDTQVSLADIEQKQTVSREYCVNKLQNIVENSDNERNQLTALSLLGDFNGFKRENAPNAEKERAILERMTDEERKLAKLAAQLRRREESQKGTESAETAIIGKVGA